MRYYSTHRPVGPGTYPRQNGTETVTNFDGPTYCEEINRGAWGYINYKELITPEQAAIYELVPGGTKGKITVVTEGSGKKAAVVEDDCAGAQEEITWYPVTVSSRKHGGGIRVFSGQVVKSAQRPEDKKGDTKKMQFKTRYFSSWQEAQRVMNVLRGLDITLERVRRSVTQGEVRVIINGKYILNFGDKIVLPKRGANPEDYYGDDIGGWRSSEPDSRFILGLIWHPLDHAYHYSDEICRILGITRNEWIEGNYPG